MQDPELRKKFTGQPEHLINFLFMVAEDGGFFVGLAVGILWAAAMKSVLRFDWTPGLKGPKN